VTVAVMLPDASNSRYMKANADASRAEPAAGSVWWRGDDVIKRERERERERDVITTILLTVHTTPPPPAKRHPRTKRAEALPKIDLPRIDLPISSHPPSSQTDRRPTALLCRRHRPPPTSQEAERSEPRQGLSDAPIRPPSVHDPRHQPKQSPRKTSHSIIPVRFQLCYFRVSSPPFSPPSAAVAGP
jgi:hypothetical protein